MANSVQILDKIARACELAGLTVNSNTGSAVVIDDGSDDILIKYQAASIQSPMGGVDDTSTPFLGIGVANPGYIVVSKNAAGNDAIADFFDNITTAKVFAILCGFANDISIQDGNEGVGTSAELVRVPGNVDVPGLGQ